MPYDVIIVGGGPAGSIAGITLMNKGLRVLLIDKCSFPRDKFCGGGISRRVFKRFPWIQDEIKSIPSNYVYKVSFRSPDGTEVCEKRNEPIYLMIRRREFDARLLNKCREGGIEVLEGQRISRLSTNAGAVELSTAAGDTFSAKLVIGADGVHSTVARKTGLNTRWAAERVAIDFMEKIPYNCLDTADRNTMYVLYGIGNSSGYGYVFPKNDHLNIGIGCLLSDFKKQRRRTPQAFYRTFFEVLENYNIVRGEPQPGNIHGAFLPMGGPLLKTFAPRILLCGDAGGFVNAFTGEGIYYAMVSGEHAAKTALFALSKNGFGERLLGRYQTDWKREIGKELSLSVRIQQVLLKHPTLIDKLVRHAKRKDSLRRAFSGYATGETAYPELKKHLIRTSTLLYAAYKVRKLFSRI